MKTSNARTPFRYHYGLKAIRLGILIIVAALATIPLYTTFSSPRTGDNAVTSTKGSDQKKAGLASRKTNTRSTNVAMPNAFDEVPSIPFLMLPQATSPSVTILEGTCTTPQSAFVLGDTVCARATGGTTFPRRITFVGPGGFIRQTTAITSDPQDITFQLPATQTSTLGNDTVDNRGTWRANMISSRGSVVTGAEFVVTDPAAPAANLSIFKLTPAGTSTVAAGSSSTFEIYVKNYGPEAAQNVVITDVVPANTTFIGMIQTSGPTFSCTLPAVGGTGTVTCDRSSLAAGDSASFDFAYQVDPGTPSGTVITNTVTISSATEDPNINDNSSSASATVGTGGGGGGTTCSVGCSDDIQVQANTTQGTEDGAIVHFSPPSGNDECGPIIVDHCNDCFFPVGITTVTGSAATGESCSFTVTVRPPGGNAPTISCPADQTGTANSSCFATVNVGMATATGGTNVTITANRSDGESMYTCDDFGNCTRNSSDAPFTYGVTTITWIASSHDIPGPYNEQTGDEDSHRTGSSTCTQTITINDVTPPTIAATDGSASADASCQAPVPDYSNTVSDNCSSGISYTQTPAAGTLVGLGSHTVHIEANDNSSNNSGAGNTSTKDVTFTVNDTTAPTVTAPADSSASGDANCQAPVPNYAAGSTASDNCDSNVTLTQSPAAGTMVGAGPHTVTVTGTDDAGNQGTDTVVFTVNDTTAPTVTAPADSSASADANCQAPVPNYAANSTASDTCDSSVTVTQSPAAGTLVGMGPHTVTVTATDDAGNHSSDDVVFTVNDTTAPTVTAPADSSASADANCQAPVPNYVAGTSASDNCDSSVTLTQSPAAGTMVGIGPHTVTVTGTDDAGNQGTDTVIFTVNDTTAPVIVFNGQTPSMWPPNHNYRTFTAQSFISSVSDNCSSLSVSDVYITKVTSDEAENAGGSGNTLNDIVIAANCKSVQLRAERVNSGNGRVYTIYFKLVDSSGNVTTGTAKVYSPKNQGETPGDNGPQYTVTSTCP